MKKREKPDGLNRLNRVKPSTNIIINIMFIIMAVMSIMPLVFVIIISLTAESALKINGYSFVPEKWSLESYKFLFREAELIFRAFGVSVFTTITGTALGVLLTTCMGYVLSRQEYRFKKFFTMVVFIPMVFGGGMVSSYVVNSHILHLKDTLWILILSPAVSSFNIVICKTFFKTTVPDSIVESAMIDGATQFTIFSRIVMPISKPVIATMALFLSFGYWNEWFLSMLYIHNEKLYGLQPLLNKIMNNITYLAKTPELGVTGAEYARSMPQEGARMAIAIVIILPIACAYPFLQKYFISGLTIGSVKG